MTSYGPRSLLDLLVGSAHVAAALGVVKFCGKTGHFLEGAKSISAMLPRGPRGRGKGAHGRF
jgi:hypothetical protein